MAWTRRKFPAWAAAALAAAAAACTYDPPPDVRLVAPPGNRFLVGDPLVLEFSEPVRADSLVVRVWPGKKDLYDLEGERLPGVVPLMDRCTPVSGTCIEGVALALAADRRTASLAVAAGALGPENQPLVLEVTGRLQDDAGRRKGVSRQFDFQIARSVVPPPGDALEPDAPDGVADVPPLPVDIVEGPHFFFAHFTSPIEISQQYWCDLRVDAATGRFLMIMTDADPLDGAPRNTTDPAQCLLDSGPEGFLFTVQGQLHRESEGADPTFLGDAFTLAQVIGPILFELRDVVITGTVSVVDGKSRWDGTMAVREVYYQVGDIEEFYPSDQANFQVDQLDAALVPAGMPRVCDPSPCTAVGGRCDLPAGTWPLPALCP